MVEHFFLYILWIYYQSRGFSSVKNCITLGSWSNSIQVTNNYISSILQNQPFSHQIHPRKTASDPSISVDKYGFSLLWILRYLARDPFPVNCFSHSSHWYGFSLLWILRCLTRDPFSVNNLLHSSQWYGNSFLWIF